MSHMCVHRRNMSDIKDNLIWEIMRYGHRELKPNAFRIKMPVEI